ncbi:hypothetical protein LOAG_16295, partial [Loa loa]
NSWSDRAKTGKYYAYTAVVSDYHTKNLNPCVSDKTPWITKIKFYSFSSCQPLNKLEVSLCHCI